MIPPRAAARAPVAVGGASTATAAVEPHAPFAQRVALVVLALAGVFHLKFRLTGKGEMKLFSLARVLEAGSDA